MTVLADPPWDVQQKGALGAAQHYNLMTLDRIKALPVGDLVGPDAHCWLWVTNATLRDGYDVLEAWGFTPRSPLTWIKPRLGLGNYLRNASEHLLLGTRGDAPVRFRAQPTWMMAPLQEHSHKPEEQYAVIERVSDGPYLELFARRRPPSDKQWSVWGDQIDSDIEIRGYPVPSDRQHRRRRQAEREAALRHRSSDASPQADRTGLTPVADVVASLTAVTAEPIVAVRPNDGSSAVDDPDQEVRRASA